MAEKRILLFAYFYPPLGGPGVQRPLKLVKYLTKFGFHVDVITVKDIQYHSYDENLSSQDCSRKTYRTNSYDPMSLIKRFTRNKKTSKKIYFNTPEGFKKKIRGFFPIDDKIGWFYPAYKKGIQLCKNYKYNYILSTIGPFTSALIAYYLSKKTKIPFIIDYRDLWTLEPYSRYEYKFQFKLASYYERKILNASSYIFTVGEVMKDQLVNRFGNHLKNKIHVMYNGYDEDDFNEVVKHTNNSKPEDKKIIYRYIGNFYGHQKVDFFIQALNELDKENLIPKNVVFEFYGNYYKNTIDSFNKLLNKDLVYLFNQVEHDKAIEKMLSTDYLLLFVSSINSQGVITGKLFEYLRSRKPILAMIPKAGEAEQILRSNGYNLITTMEDVSTIKALLISTFNGITNTLSTSTNIEEYSREIQCTKFIEKITNKKIKKKQKLFHLQLLPLLSGVQNVMLDILKPLDSKYDIYVGSKPQGPLVDEVLKNKWNYIPIDTLRRDFHILDIISFFKLYSIFKKYQFDIVHTHSSKTGFLGRIAARMAGIKHIVHTVHGLPFNPSQNCITQLIYKKLEILASKYCDKIIFVNENERIYSIKNGITSSKKSLTIYNGVKIESSSKNNFNSDKLVIGYIGRFSKQKNTIQTINTAIEICKKEKSIEFVFVGDGPDFETCLNLVCRAKLENNIKLIGWKYNTKEYLKDFDILLLYSLWEGLPLSILEAMSIGLPVICSDITGNNELVTSETGYLVKKNNPADLKKTILYISKNMNELPQKGLKAFKKCNLEFNLELFTQKHKNLYESLGELCY